jgi:hypothetical protein
MSGEELALVAGLFVAVAVALTVAKLPLPKITPTPSARSATRGRTSLARSRCTTRLRGELIRIDAVLRLLDPYTDPADVPPYRRWPRNTERFARGEIAQRVYAALRTGEIISPTQLADHAIEVKGLGDVGWKTRRDSVSKFSSILY